MTVPKKTHNKWILKSVKITYQTIADATGISRSTIQRAISDGIATPKNIKKINKYFDKPK